MRRILLFIAGFLILLAVAVPSGVLYYLLFTEGGLQFIVAHVPHEIAGTRLDIVNPTGTIASVMHVQRVEIDHHLVHLRIEGIDASIALTPLLWQTVRAKSSHIHDISIQLKRRTRPPKPSVPVFLPSGLLITVDRHQLDSLELTLVSGRHYRWTDLSASGIVRHRTIRFFETRARTQEALIEGTGELRAADPLILDLQSRVHWAPAQQPPWSFTVACTGDLKDLALTVATTTPFRSDFTGHALDLTGSWHWRGNAVIHDLDVRAWGGGDLLGLISGRLALRGNQDGYFARGPLTPAALNVGAFDATFEGAYADHVLWAKHIELTHLASQAHAAGAGTITVVRGGPRLDLRGTWRDFRWPLIGPAAPVHSPSGDYTIAGTWPYAIHAHGTGIIRDLPPMPMTVDGHLAKDRFTFESANVGLYGGRATLQGNAVWAPARSWSVAGRFIDIDSGQLRADVPGKLSFAADVAGQGFEPDGDFTLAVRDLSGRLRGVSASGGGRLARSRRAWLFDEVRIGLGRTSLALDGRVSDSLDLRFAINAQDLSLIEPDSRGELHASGTLQGTLREPKIAAAAHARSILHEGVAVGALDADIDFDPSVQFTSRVAVQIHDLVYAGRKLDSLAFKLDGKPARYAVQLDASAVGLAASVQALGPMTEGVWHGRMEAMAVTGTESLRLSLERPVDVLVSSDYIRADWLCLVGKPASMCADADWNPARWEVTFTANEMPLATVTSGLTPAVEYGGRINLHARVFGGGAEPAQGTVRADLTDAQLTHRLSSGRIEHTLIGSGLVSITATRPAIAVEVGLESGEVGTIRGKLEAQRSAVRWQDMPVQGELHAHTEALGLITLYVPDIDRAAGHLNADVRFAGTLGTPFVDGALKVSDGEIDFYQVNLALRQVSFEARLTDNGLTFGGSTHIGSGTAEARGQLAWRDSLPYGKVQLEGANLRVVDVPEAQIDASPTLTFNIEGRRIEVSGSVRVPYAKIVPADMTGAVRSSADEVVVGQESTDPSKRFEVMSTITLSLGDKVSIETSGLTGRLTGNITVRSGYDEVTSATGELSIEEGKYLAYARKLDIERGRLIFTGGPIGNPGIDIRAIKVFPDVTAGVNVRGTLLQPRMSFFSEPSLPQSQIVSLILAGGGLETAQNRQSGTEALAQGGAILAQQLGSRIGIEDVSLESDLQNETSLVLGKYLSPRFYVSYGISLTEQLNVFKMRYSLGDHWTVKTEVGQARGADLVFTIDK